MPNYYVDIYDTTDDTHSTVLEKARANSILLGWQGKDAIDELDVIGSRLAFTLEATWDANDDGAFIHLFTGNEVKYRVDLRLESDDSLVWQGFLLPDSYSEPYKTGNFFVDVEATDGLGRLKGKFLPDVYYEEEKSVIDIISTCLSLTGLQFDIVFAPGIDNKTVKDWNSIYIDGLNYVDNDRNWTAYKILQTFLQDTLSCVYQHKGVWYVEGLNKRNLLEYSAKKYDYEGTLLSDYTVAKEVKTLDGKILGSANVAMVPPYNNITVTHTATALQLPETIAEEENDGWVTEAAGVSGVIYATDWYPNDGDFWAMAKAPDYKVYLEGNDSATLNYNHYVQLRKKIYVKQDTKLKFTLELGIDYYGTENSDTIDTLIEDGDWTNPMYYKIQVGGETLFTNIGADVTTAETIQFDSDKEARVVFEFIIPESGLLDVWLYQPFGTYTSTKIKGIFINNIELENIGFDENIVYETTINENYTVDKEHELVFADDATGLSKCFLLGKLNENNPSLFKAIGATITDAFTQNGNFYSVVSLEDANLIADNIDSVGYAGTLLENLEVIYNYGGGEQMVVKTDSAYTSGQFSVIKYKLLDYTADRDSWEEWTDSVYVVERKRYPDAVMGVFSRLFENPLQRLDATVQEIVHFGDMLSFTYMAETSRFVPTNCTYNLDKGTTSIVSNKASYLQENALVPPYVDAGPDIFLYDNDNQVGINATAYDPDGTIVSYLWEHVSGTPAGTIVTPTTEDTFITGLTGDQYEYQITVTDNDGLTASDTVQIIRVINYTVSLTETASDIDNSGSTRHKEYEYTLEVDPSFNSSLFMTLNCIVDLSALAGGLGNNTADAYCSLSKNGNVLQEWELNTAGGIPTDSQTLSENTLIGFISTDDIKVVLRVDRFNDGGGAQADATFTIDFGTITDYPGVVLGPPLEQTISIT